MVVIEQPGHGLAFAVLNERIGHRRVLGGGPGSGAGDVGETDFVDAAGPVLGERGGEPHLAGTDGDVVVATPERGHSGLCGIQCSVNVEIGR